MKQKLLFLLLAILCSFGVTQAQVLTTIGAGTTSNTTTGYPAPFGNWYQSSKHQMIYTAAELTTAGITPGALINGVGVNVTAFNTSTLTYTGFSVGVGTTTTSAFTGTHLAGPSNIYTGSYTPTLGWNMFSMASPMVWNGTDNLIIETCHPQNAPYTQNMSVQYTATTTNQAIYVRSDIADQCPITTGTNSLNRPNLQISYLPPAGCIQPISLTSANITTVGADIGWTDPNTTAALNYDIFYDNAGAPAPTNTTVGQVLATTTNPNTITTMMPNIPYDVYVRAHCTATDTSAWAGPITFTTAPLCAVPTALTAANFVYTGTNFTADLGWTDNNTTSPGMWDIELQASPGTLTGSANLPGQTMNPATTPPALTPNTTYVWAVRAACGGTAGNSPWSAQGTFTTPCAPFGVAAFNIAGTFETGAIPGCWTQNAASVGHWKFTGTPGNPTMTALNHTTTSTTTNLNGTVAWCDGSGALANESFELTSAPILNADIVAMTNPLLTFYLTEDNGNATPALLLENNQFKCQLSYDGGATFIDATSDRAENGKDLWARYSVEIDKVALGTNDLTIRFIMNTLNLTASALPYSFYNDHAIDDVNISDATCASLFTGIATAAGVADCQCEDLAGVTHYGDQTTSALSLSITKVAKNDPNIVANDVYVGGTTAGVTSVVAGGTAAAGYGNPDVNMSPDVFVMNRFWDVDITDATRQPTANVDVRFYYGDADLAMINSALGALSPAAPAITHTDMYAYKINNGTVATVDPVASSGHASIVPADYIHLMNGAASTTTWAYSAGAMAGTHNMDMQVASFSGGGGGSPSIPLPVDLINFNVVKNGSVSDVTWTTATEKFNSHFNVERSTNGTDFTTIGRVESKAPNGTSALEINYNFTDNAPEFGHNYYRLAQVDIDTKVAYSNVLDVIWGANGDVVSIYPNPVRDILNVDINVTKASQMEVRITDMTGRVIKTSLLKTQSGVNNMTIDLQDLASGLYNVQVTENNRVLFIDQVRKN